jgi:hypothetical protein
MVVLFFNSLANPGSTDYTKTAVATIPTRFQGYSSAPFIYDTGAGPPQVGVCTLNGTTLSLYWQAPTVGYNTYSSGPSPNIAGGNQVVSLAYQKN